MHLYSLISMKSMIYSYMWIKIDSYHLQCRFQMQYSLISEKIYNCEGQLQNNFMVNLWIEPRFEADVHVLISMRNTKTQWSMIFWTTVTAVLIDGQGVLFYVFQFTVQYFISHLIELSVLPNWPLYYTRLSTVPLFISYIEAIILG